MVLGTRAKLWKHGIKFRKVKWELYERVVIQTVLYGSEAWSLRAQESRKIEVFKMMCLRNICGINRVERVRNSLISESSGCQLSVLERMKE